MSIRSTIGRPRRLALASVVVLAMLAGADEPPRLDPFQCYRTSGFCAADSPRRQGIACDGEKICGGSDGETTFCLASGFQGRTFALEDRFESGRFDARKPLDLCNPATVEGSEPADPVTHFRGYDLRRSPADPPQPEHVPVRGLRVENALHPATGELVVDTVKPDRLILPSAKSHGDPVAPPDPAAHDLEPMQCYRVEVAPGSPELSKSVRVAVDDPFAQPKIFRLVKPSQLCVPTSVDGRAVDGRAPDLFCYLVQPDAAVCSASSPQNVGSACSNERDCGGTKGKTSFCATQPPHVRVAGLRTANELAEERFDTIREEELCLPSRAIGGAVDRDGDGFTGADGDCDDGDAGVHPGALESCDGRDENCDGELDEGLGETTCGVGACERTVANCLAGEPQGCVPGEPSPEACGNGLDDDCDGEIDDRAECSPSCIAGTPCRTEEPGVCGDGTTACPEGPLGATVCVADREPASETCDGRDQDCDGEVDEGLGETTCGVGACERTVANCLGGEPRECAPGEPAEEICGDDVDEDCDGVVAVCPVCAERECCDTGLAGECARGRATCPEGESGAALCAPAAASGTELRNGGFELAVGANASDSNGWSSRGIAAEGGWSESGGSPGGYFTLRGDRSTTSDPVLCQAVSCVVPGRTYALGGLYRSADPASGDPAKTDALAVVVDGALVLGLARPSPDPLAWTPLAVSFEAPSSSFEICLAAERDGDGSSFDVDEIVIADPATEEICNGEDDDCDGETDEDDVCATPTPVATATPPIVPTAAPTSTVTPTETSVPAATLTPTPTATSTPAATPTRAAACLAPPDDLVLWLPADGSPDDVTSYDEGTVRQARPIGNADGGSGPAPGFGPGKVREAFSLSGTRQLFSLADRDDQWPAGSFTIHAWISTTTLDRTIVSKYECALDCPAGANSYYQLYVSSLGTAVITMRDSDASPPGSAGVGGVTNVADGAFHHVAAQRDVVAGKLRIYVDGELDGETALNPGSDGVLKNDDGKPDPFDIGGIGIPGSHSWTSLFAGSIDEVQYLSRALTSAEIREIYEAGAAGYCKEGLTTGVCREGVACTTGSPGICADGHTTCPDGADAPPFCAPIREPVEEVCASETDDDCDGEVDEAECRSDAAPTAEDDAYDTRAGETLNVGAPGVLANDTDPDGAPLTARLIDAPFAGEVTLEPDGSFDYTPDPVGTGGLHESVNLTMLLRPTVSASSATFDLALGRTTELSLVDGDTIRSWCTTAVDRAAWAEEGFAEALSVREIRHFAVNDGNYQRNFTKGVFELFGSTGTLLFATPEVTFVLPSTQNWPAPAPSTVVDVEAMAGGPVTGVRRVRFRATAYQQPSGAHCVSELHVHGDSPLAPSPVPAEVNLGELYAVGLEASGSAADIHRPEAANDEHPSTAWYASSSSGASYEMTFPSDVTATRVEVDAPFTQVGGGAQAGNVRCGGQFQLFDANDALLADTGEVTIDTGNASQRSFAFPSVAGVRRMRLTQTQTCSLYQIGFTTYPMGFGAIRLIGPPPAPLPRFEMFERYRVAGAAHSTPLVANLTDHNGDGRVDRLDVPDVVTIVLGSPTVQSGFIQAVRGDDGMAVFSAGAPNLVSSFSEPAIGDIDGDGLPEIVAVHADGNHLIAFENDGTEKWVSEAHPQPRAFIGSTTVVTGAVAIANLDGAGAPEIVVGAAVYDADGNLLGDGAALGGTSGGGTSAGGPKRAAISAIADVDLDGVAEIVAGPTAYEVRSGGLFKQWQRTDRADGFVGIANFDTDPEGEIVVVANGEISMLNHDGSDAEVWNPPTHEPIPLPVGGSGGAPTIGDLDGDGVPEIGVAGFWGYAAFRRDGTVLWQTAISDSSSNSTGSTVFDFEQDGSVEVIYRDERWLRVYRGKDGFLLAKRLLSSTTWTEMPVVADVDGDGDGEIVVVGEGGSAGISVFEDVGGGFAPTRRIWNQHAYSITNVNEDGTIPPAASPNWLALGLNDFRLNAFGPDDVRDREDAFTYVANDGSLDSPPATVRIRVEANRPPLFVSTPPTRAGAGIRYSYAARVSDPDPGDTITFSLPLGPEGMTIDPASGLVGWTPTTAQTGEHPVTIRVADEDGNVALQKYAVTVGESGAEDVDDDGDGLSENQGDCNDADPSIRPGAFDVPGDGIDQDCDGADGIDRRTTDDDGDGVSENEGDCNDADAGTYPGAPDPPGDGIDQDCTGADGDDPTLADLDGDGFSVAFGDCDDTDPSIHPGAFDIPGDGIDQNCNGADSIEGDDAPPVATIATPADLAEVTAPTDVLGTAADEHFLRYTLELASVDDPAATTVIGSGTTAISNGVLGRLDPTLLENGLYLVRLTVEDVNGNLAIAEVVYRVTGEQKVGHFRVSFNDLTVPLSGIPIVLTRTYDSRVKTTEDFGIGWTLDVGRGRYQNNRPPGEGWQIRSQFIPGLGSLPCRSAEDTRGHLTEVRLSDRESYTFALILSEPHAVTGGCEATASFRFIDGETLGAKLQILDGGGAQDAEPVFYELGSDQVVDYDDLDSGRPYGPRLVRLITADGRTIDFELGRGITRLEDLNGNAVVVGEDGIAHSSGRGVTFTRDGLGRIRTITDPAGEVLQYAYDASGDLVSFIDQAGNETIFLYDANHHLLEIVDPLGNRAVRNEYDADGRLVATIDAAGNRVELTHHLGQRQEVVRDRLGRVTVHEYDAAGNVIATTDALGHRREFTYDADGNPLTETDPLGRVATRTYDASGNVRSSTDFDGNTTTYAYDARNQPTTTTDAEGRTVTNVYDLQGNLTEAADGTGAITQRTYDSAGNERTTIDPLGHETHYAHDAFGNMTSTTSPLGVVTTVTYDAKGNRTSQTRAGRTITYAHDELGRPVGETSATGAELVIAYEGLGSRVAAATDANGNTVSHAYDERGNLTETRFPDGSTQSAAHDAGGQVTSVTNRDGHAEAFEYDALGRRTKETHPDGSFRTIGYDAVGRVVSRTNERGHPTAYAMAPNRETVTDALGNPTVHEFDSHRRRVRVTDALGRVTRFEYDGNGRLVKTTFADGSTATASYDAAGRRTSETDPSGRTVRFEYDAAGRLVKAIDAAGGETVYGYDDAGNVITQTDAEGRVTRMEYDASNRLVRRVRPLGQSETFAYDASGNLVSHTDFNGETVTIAYDVNHRPSRKQLPGGSTVDYGYTAAGLRTRSGADTFTYDARGRLLKDEKATGEAIAYTYDAAGNRTSVTTPYGATSYAYDAANRLVSVTDAAGTTSYAYDAVGNLASATQPNGVVATYGYDPSNRLIEVETTGPSGLLASYAYTLDASGRRIGIVESGPATPGRSVTYAYDAAGRLVGETIDGPGTTADRQITYTYDAVGNRLTKTDVVGTRTVETSYVYDANDRLTSETIETIVAAAAAGGAQVVLAGYGLSPFLASAASAVLAGRRRKRRGSGRFAPRDAIALTLAAAMMLVPAIVGSGLDLLGPRTAHAQATTSTTLTYTYDDNGNMLRRSDGSGTDTYTYDVENRLIAADVQIGSSPGLVTYAYDADGNRTAKTVAGLTTSFLVDRNRDLPHVVAESENGQTTTYTHGLDLVSLTRPGTGTRYYLHDGFGSTRGLADATGALTDAYAYDAFGVLLDATGTTPNAYLYRGEQLDAELGLYYLRARYYSPSTGRFVTTDPERGSIDDPVSLHRYLYANADPVNFVDPTGRSSLMELAVGAAIVGALTGFAIGATIGYGASDAGISRGYNAFIGGVVGAVLGALLGATFAFFWALSAIPAGAVVQTVGAGAEAIAAGAAAAEGFTVGGALIAIGQTALAAVGIVPAVSAREAVRQGLRQGSTKAIQRATRSGVKTVEELAKERAKRGVSAAAAERMKNGAKGVLGAALLEDQLRGADELVRDVEAVPGGDEIVDAYLGTLTITLADDGISPRTRRAASHAHALFQ